MSKNRSVSADQGRHAIAEAMVGGAVGLVAITVAHAALPDVIRPPRLAPTSAIPPHVAPPLLPPAPQPVLIAFAQPLPDGEVGSRFGLRQMPWEEQPRLHAGVDMVAPAPEPVRAAADGVVTRIGEDPGYGRFVELTHAEGLTTLYGHLERFADGIATGIAVKAGTAVGQLGSTGSSTGVHLHFEIHDRDGHPLNPELFLGRSFAAARDLPLREAQRAPRGVRVAYVSRIPKSKQAMMQARLDEEAEDAAGETSDAGQSTGEARPQRTGRPLIRSHLRS